KLATYEFLRRNGFPHVEHISSREATAMSADPDAPLPFPLVVKPRFGSCSAGVQTVNDREELAFYLKRTENPIVQRRAEGREFTINFLVGRNGQCLVAVPHWRIETRG